jgi:hypothetical protein
VPQTYLPKVLLAQFFFWDFEEIGDAFNFRV